MIANISPTSVSVEHTLNTLRYADRVKGACARRSVTVLIVVRKCVMVDAVENVWMARYMYAYMCELATILQFVVHLH